MTLNGVMAVILRYFSEFAYLTGVLLKSSRSLLSSHDVGQAMRNVCYCDITFLVYDSDNTDILQIYEYFMVAIISTIFIMIHHAVSHIMIFAVLDV